MGVNEPLDNKRARMRKIRENILDFELSGAREIKIFKRKCIKGRVLEKKDGRRKKTFSALMNAGSFNKIQRDSSRLDVTRRRTN